MDDLDAALAGTVPEPETARTVVATIRPCRRHQWRTYPTSAILDGVAVVVPNGPTLCHRCGKPQDIERSRRGKSARRRGNDYERTLAASLGGIKVGHHGGPEDVRGGMFNYQSKVRATGAFPGWMSDELAKLPRTGDRTPALVIAEAPGPGRRRRALVVVTLEDWRALHQETSDPA